MTAPFSELRITLAQVKDSAVLSQVAARTFQDAYQEGNTAENIRLYLEENCQPEIFARELQEADKKFFLAWSGAEACGYGAIRENPPPKCVRGSRPVELYKLYVDQNALSRGAGSALMEACLAHAVRMNFETIWLSVWEKAERARAFYGKWKFLEVGRALYRVGNDLQPDIIMERSISRKNVVSKYTAGS